MKLLGEFLVLTALAVSTDALARFDKASCLSSAPTTPINVAAGDGSWNCITFNLAQSGVFTVPFIKAGSSNVALEIMLWNDGRTDSDTANGDTRWLNSAGPEGPTGPVTTSSADNAWMRKFIPGGNDPQSDFNNVDFSQNATRGGKAMAMRSIEGYTTRSGNNGVYAWYTSSSQIVTFAEGRNYIQMWHPNRLESRTVGTFGGKFMYRLLNRDGNVDDINSATIGVARSNELLPVLNVGAATTVEHLALPGFDLYFRINHEFVEAGYALKGFAYTAAYSGNGVGSLVNQQATYSLPTGYTAYGDANLTFSSSAGNQLKAGNNWNLYQNYTKTGNFSPAAGVETVTFASDTTTLKNNWTLPLDVATTNSATNSDFGVLSVHTPNYELGSGVAAALAYDWSSQTSPFIDVTVTINEIVTYPLLSELSNLELRNWDTDEDAGHNLLSPTQQQAFGIYRVRLDTTLWWSMRVQFNDVRDMNAPAGVTAGESLSEECQPLWELQVVNDFNTDQSTSVENRATTWGRRQNGYGIKWEGGINRVNTPEGYDWEAGFGGSKLLEDGHGYVLNQAWAKYSGRVEGPDRELAFMPATRSSWYLIRVSALPRVLPGSGTFAGQCGSNHIRIGSASLQVLGVAGECSSSRDCMVDADDHPAKDRADSDDSANGDASRFSRCVVTVGISVDGRRTPSTQCMECMTEAHCRSGQYCHLDDGRCSLEGNSPDGRYPRFYVCDAESRALFGVCREKSSDVLGKTCKPHTAASQTSFAAMQHPALGEINTLVTGGSGGLAGGSNDVMNPNTLDPQRFDPSNEDFGEGSGGICGEFLYYNSSGVTSFVDTDVQGNFFNPYFARAGIVRNSLWWGVCDEDRICRECLPGAGSQGNNAQDGRICLNGKTFSAKDVDGTHRSYNANTQAGTQLGTTFMVILLIVLFAFYMYAQAKEFRHANGMKPMSCCETILCCGACSKLEAGGSSSAAPAPAPAAADTKA